MKYIYYTNDCFICGKTNYYCYITRYITKCYICGFRTDKRYKEIIGNWDWA